MKFLITQKGLENNEVALSKLYTREMTLYRCSPDWHSRKAMHNYLNFILTFGFFVLMSTIVLSWVMSCDVRQIYSLQIQQKAMNIFDFFA